MVRKMKVGHLVSKQKFAHDPIVGRISHQPAYVGANS